jgi:hypothetical protein
VLALIQQQQTNMFARSGAVEVYSSKRALPRLRLHTQEAVMEKVATKEKELMVECKDEPGAGAAVLGLLADAKLNLTGMIGYGAGPGKAFVHVFGAELAKAKKLLTKSGYTFRVNDVLSVSMSNKAGAFSSILKKVGAAGVNLSYGYAMGIGGKGCGVLYLQNPADLSKALKAVNAAPKK